jgi:Recombination endonuclease VII
MGKAETAQRAWAKRLWDNYKLTPEQWQKIYDHQGGVCYICGRPEHVAGRRLAVDHSHLDGLIRGLLCSKCNPLLGKLENAFVRLGMKKDGLNLVAIVLRIALYVKSPSATEALGAPVYGYAGRTGTKKHRKMLKKLRKSVIPSKQLLPGE